MSSISLDFSGLYAALGLALAAAVLTPLFWRLAAGLPRGRRALLAILAAQGVAGIGAAILALDFRDREIPFFTLVFTALLQAGVLAVLLLRRRRP